MIKCNVTTCGVITSSAEEKTSKEGEKFISFSMVVPFEGKDGTVKEQYISVSAPGDAQSAANYSAGRRVTVSGVLHIRKHDSSTYLNLRTDTNIEFNESTTPDRLVGSMEFRGKISKKGIKDFNSKKGKPMQSFSAFSSDKNGENYEFTWVSFINLSPIHEEYLAADKYVEVHGDLQLDVFKGELQLECKVKSIAPWELNKRLKQMQSSSHLKHSLLRVFYVFAVLAVGVLGILHLLFRHHK